MPVPPYELANRVGCIAGANEPLDYYEKMGRDSRAAILERLPADWTFSGKRILDFGCGAGRTLRQFTDETADAEFWGCDIDEASIAWMKEYMSPPFQVFANDPDPPLDQPSESFDLIWAVSVFTHLASNWSGWLMELRRLLKPGALLLVTFMGRGMSELIADEPWNEDLFGMNVIKYGQSWDLGGPMVLHSPWWIREHWGRAFEIVELEPDGFATKPWLDHGCVLMRRREVAVEPGEAERVEPGDPRETRALAHNVAQLHAESVELRESISYLESKLAESAGEREAFVRELEATRDSTASAHRDALIAQHDAATARQQSTASAVRLLQVEEALVQSRARTFALEEALEQTTGRLDRACEVMSAMQVSVSWRITAPLRALKRLLRRTGS
jgi:SAM-dependent methyltransferase